MFVQLLYGYWTNSLGLISDAIHMFFDCLALGVGLFAAVAAKWPANKQYSFGFGRLETLAGFSNAVFLILISISIFVEALQRLMDPPEMKTDRLLLVSFVGLLVNLIGILAFNHGHAHGHHHHHDEHSHDHHHHHHHHHHHGSSNMHAVFLHVLADTMGSVGVIISTLLIEYTGWTGFDPLASIMIAGLIFASVVPLVKETAGILLLKSDSHLTAAVSDALHEISGLDGVISYTTVHFFPVSESEMHGILHVQVRYSADQSYLLGAVQVICQKRIGVTRMTVQLEPENGWLECKCGGFIEGAAKLGDEKGTFLEILCEGGHHSERPHHHHHPERHHLPHAVDICKSGHQH